MSKTELILASKSASRNMLMKGAGLVFKTEVAPIDEREVEEPLLKRDAAPHEIAIALAEAKATAVSHRHPGAYVVGSDQTLSLDKVIFHKPRDLSEAAAHIRAFSGKSHHLNCGVAIARAGKVLWSDISIAVMTMREISEDFLQHYIEMAGPDILQSVGAYQLEGVGVQLFADIEGDYFTILGLPMLKLLAGLRQVGAIDG